MVNIINAIVGDLNEKKRYRNNEKRAKELPGEYAAAYKEIRNYLWTTSGILTIDPLITLVEMLEEAAAEKRKVTDITGPDGAAFADELVRGEKSYKEQQGEKLNKKLNNKG
jgi:DNA-binding ferritin-like protein (Dps family)